MPFDLTEMYEAVINYQVECYRTSLELRCLKGELEIEIYKQLIDLAFGNE